MTPAFAEVVLPLPLGAPYTYAIPAILGDRVGPGARVVVPLRRRELVGVVTAVGDDPPPVPAKEILAAPDGTPAVSGPLLETAQWIAGYYGAPIGLAVRAILPGGLWGASRLSIRIVDGGRAPGGLAGQLLAWLEARGGSASTAAAARHFRRDLWGVVDRLTRVGAAAVDVLPPEQTPSRRSERVLRLVRERLTLVERAEAFRRRPRQREVFELVESLGGAAPVATVRDQLKVSDGVIRTLVERGIARIDDIALMRDPFADDPGVAPPPSLTPDQVGAVEALYSLGAGEAALLVGVTGSGKTHVYLEVIRRLVAGGRGAIILVPEISLTPQTVSRVRGVFGNAVAVLHSGLSDGERADAWGALRRGERRIAVGARSAVFAPVQDLAMIVIDEEHEPSYKNAETPRYHARDVALVRARLEGATVVLGSATPSLEIAAQTGDRIARVPLPVRIGGQPLPPVDLVDLRTVARVPEAQAVPWSETLDSAVVRALARGEQILLLLNRRGFASYLQCLACGAVRQCPRCSISLTVHRGPARLRCHYCGHEEPPPDRCTECDAALSQMRGVGTQQLEQFLAARFPQARLARMDLDTTSTKWSHQRILERVARREVDVLLGTQMIAKGLDFPNVTLVGVVDADTALYLPDFRSPERTFQLVAQVAGRAGRGPLGGTVVVQTRNPGHYALRYAVGHDSDGFVREELEVRRSPPYPPHVALVNLVIAGREERRVGREAGRLADWCQDLVDRFSLPLTVLGPAPAPLARIKDRWRHHVVLKGPGAAIGRVVRYAAGRLPTSDGTRVVIDRDPVSLL